MNRIFIILTVLLVLAAGCETGGGSSDPEGYLGMTLVISGTVIQTFDSGNNQGVFNIGGVDITGYSLLSVETGNAMASDPGDEADISLTLAAPDPSEYLTLPPGLISSNSSAEGVLAYVASTGTDEYAVHEGVYNDGSSLIKKYGYFYVTEATKLTGTVISPPDTTTFNCDLEKGWTRIILETDVNSEKYYNGVLTDPKWTMELP